MTEEPSTRPLRKARALAAALILLTIFIIGGFYAWKNRRTSALFDPLPHHGGATPGIVASPYQLAVQKVEQDRGEPTGNQASISVPAELKHYTDRRRFLAMQVAEWREQNYEIPHDFAELASMINAGEFTMLTPLGSSYILYGVGIKADDELTHYDQQAGKSIPLFSGEEEIQKELLRLHSRSLRLIISI